jgi:hypothetical protein
MLIAGKQTALSVALEDNYYAILSIDVSPPTSDFIGRSVLQPSVINRYAGNIRDPVRMFTSVAGVSNMSDDRNDLSVRANSPVGLLWKMEGIDTLNSTRLNRINYMEDELYSKQYSPYFRCDIKLGLLINSQKMTHIISFDIRNVFNHKNIYENYHYLLNQEIQSYTMYQLGFFPVIIYKLNF